MNKISVRIPLSLRKMVKGVDTVFTKCGSIDDILYDLIKQFPSLNKKILWNRFICIFVNDVECYDKNRMIDVGDEISLIPMISGGSNRIPGAQSQIQNVPNLITGGNNIRKPVIIGCGDIKVLVDSEKVVRGVIAGGKDKLISTLFDINSVLKVGNSPGSSNWLPTTHYTVDTATNSIDWASGSDIAGNTTITQYGAIQTGESTTTFTSTNTGVWSAVDNYYVGGKVTITNPDSSNYGLTQTVTAYTGSTRTFVVDAFAHTIDASATFIVNLEPDEPAAGGEYYVSYYKKLNNFTITEYTSEADIKANHGGITLSNSTDTTTAPNKITIGALSALREGAQSVMVAQLDYTSWGNKYSPTESEFNASLSIQLESLKSLIDYKLYLVPMSTWSTSISKVVDHCKIQSAPENKAERACVAGLARGTSVATFKSTAQGFKTTRLTLPAPSETRFSDLLTVPMDGDIMAAAYAGKRCATPRISASIMGETFSSISIETLYTPVQQRDLLGVGIAVIVSIGGIASVLHDKTTNPATADTEENSSVEIADYMNRQIRDTLWGIFKGAPIDKSLPGAMAATMKSIFEKEIQNNNIVEYKNISVQQDPSEPRQMNVNASLKQVYNTIWINISLSLYV